MIRITKKHVVVVLMFGLILLLYNCTRHDQTLNVAPAASTILTSVKTTNAPTFVTGGSQWGGATASQWSAAPKLTVTCTVPDVEGGSNVFSGFIGNSTAVTMQSMYDANNIYFLISWNASQPNMVSSPWYFNPATKRWAQGGAAPTYNVDGQLTMQSFVSDEFVMLFNINSSCADFKSQSCYGACHQNVPSSVVDTPTGVIATTTTNCMHTNAPNEKLDCWRARFYEVPQTDQLLDYYIDWAGGVAGGSGIHTDMTVPPLYAANNAANGVNSISNTQKLKITGTSTTVSVPLWVKPSGSTYTNDELSLNDTLGAALKVTAVDSNGVLTLSNGTTLDPTQSTTYQLVGLGIGDNNEALWIPGKIMFPYTVAGGGVSDVTANAVWTGSGWQMMLKRALKTADLLEQDVDFSPLTDQQFGIGVMFQAPGSVNAADNEHAIMPGLTLTFKK